MGIYEPVHKPHLGTVVTPHKDHNSEKLGISNNRVLDLCVDFMRLLVASTLDQLPIDIDGLTGVVIRIFRYIFPQTVHKRSIQSALLRRRKSDASCSFS